MFNLKQAKQESVSSQEELLSENRKGKALGESIGSHEWLLDDNRKGSETIITEGQLKREGDQTKGRLTEGQLESHTPPEGYAKRDASNEKAQMNPLAALNAAQENERLKQFEDEGGVTADTKFWDKYVASQLLGEETSIPAQVSSSQLQNSYDRLKGLKVDDMGKHEGVKKMVMASMKDADAVLFYVYHKAATESRDLNADEKTVVDGITADKIKLASLL